MELAILEQQIPKTEMKAFATFRLDVADQSLWRDDRRVPLTPKAFAVLQYLVDRAGRLVTQKELLEALWPDTFVQPEVLKSQIQDVRAALGDRAKDPLYIETISRRGYRFIATVSNAAIVGSVEAKLDISGLVGRGDDLAELWRCLDRADGSERQVVFVTGEQGMGKTTLVDAFLDKANAKGIAFARGQCLEGYGVVKEPYYPVLEALGQLARSADGAAFAQVLETQAPTWLIQLPALVKPEHRNILQRELLGATRERMIRELCEALESLTKNRALILLFEDLHWADLSTVDLIAAIAHRRFPAKLLLIGTYRPVDLVLSQHPLKQASHSLKSHRLAKEIALLPLVETEVEEYLSQHGRSQASGDASEVQNLAQWIRKQSEGNPLFMVNIIEHLVNLGHIMLKDSVWKITVPLDQIEISIPETLRQMIEIQVERLSPQEQLTLEAASVHRSVFSAAVTAAVLEVGVESVEDICQKLAQQHHMIRAATPERLPDGTLSQCYEFVHAAYRHVFYNRLTHARRAKLHQRIGETVETIYAGALNEIGAELAGHFEECAVWPKAVSHLWLAIQNAWRRLAYREAVSAIEHGLELTEKLAYSDRITWELRLREKYAVLAHALYEPSRALPILETLSARAAHYGKAEIEGNALIMQMVMRVCGDAAACVPLLERLRSLTPEDKSPLKICTFGWNAQFAHEHKMYLDQVRLSGNPAAIATQQMDHCYVEWLSSQYALSRKHAQECLPTLLESGQVLRFLLGRELVAVNHIFLGDWGSALDVLDEAIENADKNAAPHRLAMPLLFKAWLHQIAMDYDGALEMCSAALPSLTDPNTLDRRYFGLRVAASAELGQARYEAAIQQLLDLRTKMQERPVLMTWYWTMNLQLDLVDGHLALGEIAKARIEATRALELALATAERTWQGLAWETSARVAVAAGEESRMRSDIASGIEAINGFDVPLAAWRVHRTAARIAHLDGNFELENKHRTSGSEIALSLAKSLDGRPRLREIFLASAAVSELLQQR